MTFARFQKTILDWYKKNKRDKLPWRRTRDPYKILVSEVMLQQTQISRVLPKYKEFLKEFPTLEALAKAPDKKLLKAWSGLGYWRRAKHLKETSKIIMQKYKGEFPEDVKELEKLPGVGPYTARAVSCFAFGNCEVFLDTNIRRVYLHFFFENQTNVSDSKIIEVMQKVTTKLCHGNKLTYDNLSPREWYYALFDYGAVELKDKQINKRSSHYAKQSKFEGSFRSYRTKVVRHILAHPQSKVPHQELRNLLKDAPYPPSQIIQALLRDNLIKKSRTHYFV